MSENNLCNYYDLDKTPGIKAKGKFVSETYGYLDDKEVFEKLVQFSGDDQVNVTFRLPGIHCASCVYLLENLHRIEPGVITSQVNFPKQEIFISFNPKQITLRKVVELLGFIGYEPDINLSGNSAGKSRSDKKKLYRIGIAGFCFANIMMLSFPEYFAGGAVEEWNLQAVFTWLIFALSLPVLFYSFGEIFVPAIKGLRHGDINIDVPIALASIITFGRSYYEIISHTGAGYLDSGTGIIFFMLVGRWFQGRTNESLQFDRDYRSYFPLGVTVIRDSRQENIPVTKLKVGDKILVRNSEMIPADSVLLDGKALIDYSFVTGEKEPVKAATGEIIYAGGKQTGASITLVVKKEASGSYITRLWNNDVFFNRKNNKTSYIHPWSRYFTIILFTIAASAAVYWGITDPSKIWIAVTSTLIVACPCSLLLSATFTYGNMLRIFSRNHLYMKNSSVIEAISSVNLLVLDKTGTITGNKGNQVSYSGKLLSDKDYSLVKHVASQSSHNLSQSIARSLKGHDEILSLNKFKEEPGKGVQANIENKVVRLGSSAFIHSGNPVTGSAVHIEIDNEYKGFFSIKNDYREGIKEMANHLNDLDIETTILSGDNANERSNLKGYFGNINMIFNASPSDKLEFIREMQKKGRTVLMVGDGLNDAGALMQADAGVAVSDNAARFTPACDAIIDGDSIHKLGNLIRYARAGKGIVISSFILSILYNFVGISFAVSGNLSPLVAAILMPASSISIILLVTFLSGRIAAKFGL